MTDTATSAEPTDGARRAKLSPDAGLRLAPEVDLNLSGDRLIVRVGPRQLALEANMLAVLDAFRRPMSLRQAMQQLAARTKLEWIELSANILRMVEKGVLVSEAPAIAAWTGGFASPSIHVRMLDDRVRTGRFIDAIRAVVREGDVVVDLGSGTGVLAIAAVQAGARRVYAIESAAIADCAQRMFEANGVADRVTLIREHSTRVELPERADVLVSEIVGNGPFEEHILTYTRDALARLLKPSARLVPSALRVLMRPVRVGEPVRHEHCFTERAVNRWTDAYGIDFTTLGTTHAEQAFEIPLRREEAAKLQPLGDSVELTRVDLSQPPDVIDAQTELHLDTAARLDGIVVHFEVALAAGHEFGNDPWSTDSATNWGIPLWLLPHPKMTGEGETVRVRYRYTGARAMLDLI